MATIVKSPAEVNSPPTQTPERLAFFARVRSAAARERDRRNRQRRRALTAPQFVLLNDILQRLGRIENDLRDMVGDHWHGCPCRMCSYLDETYGTGWRQDLITLESVLTMYRSAVEGSLPLPLNGPGADGSAN